jgi:AcrR family transcriptional regulator
MSPRPRKVSDQDIFAAAYRAMQRLGPAELTLAEIAAEAGVTAGALVQRFGSKRELQVALAASAAGSSGDLLRGLRARHRSPLAAVRAYASCMAGLASSPEALSRNLQYLANDVGDPDLRTQLLVQSRATRAALLELLDEAARAGELAPRTDTAALARVVETVIGGALFSWAIYRTGTAERWLSEHVDAVLAAHLAHPRRGRRSRAPGARPTRAVRRKRGRSPGKARSSKAGA